MISNVYKNSTTGTAAWSGCVGAALTAFLVSTACASDDTDGGAGHGGSGGSEDAGTGGDGATAGEGGSGGSNAGDGGDGGSSAGSDGEGGSSGDAGAGGEGGSSAGSGGESGSGGLGGDGGSTGCDITPPPSYEGAAFYTNTGEGTPIQALVTGLASLVTGPTGLMTVTEVPITTDPAPVPPTATELAAAFQAGEPSLFSVSTGAFQDLADAMFTEHAEASLATWDGTPAQWEWSAAPANQGGVWHRQVEGTSARIFNERALETRQFIDKGAFSGAFYSYALSLLDSPVSSATVDVLARALGVENPTLPIAPHVVPSGTYVRTANYAHAVGLMTPIKDALIRAQAFAGAEACEEELASALDDLLKGWERGAMGRVVFYSYRALTGVPSAVDEFEVQSAIHQLAEAQGLAVGWKGIERKIISDAELETLLELMQIPGLPAMDGVTTHALLGNNPTDAETAVQELGQALEHIQEVYDFSDAQMENFKGTDADGTTPG